MSRFPSPWRAIATMAVLAGATSAAPALTTIEDVLYKADGSRFNGTLTITWNTFQSGDNTPIPVQGATFNVVNGILKIRLVPTTNASPGANYTVKYSSQGKYQFTELWAVPPSTNVLRVRDVRVATGTQVGPPPPVLTQMLISDVTGLSNELGVRPLRGAGYGPSHTAVINSSGQVDAAAGNLSDCVHVDGTSGPCGAAALSTSGTGSSFADSETPSGLVNGVNTSFTLNFAPNPASSLQFFRNGILMKRASDYTLSGSVVTFFTVSAPQAGDLLTAYYRYIPGQ